jgi:hypothetical protein
MLYFLFKALPPFISVDLSGENIFEIIIKATLR